MRASRLRRLVVQALLQLLAQVLAVGEAEVACDVLGHHRERLAYEACELLVAEVRLLNAHELAEVAFQKRPEVFLKQAREG